MSKIFFLWFPGTWEVDMFKNENPSPSNFVGLGLWLVDKRFPDRLPLSVFEPIMMCPPGYMASFGPIPAAGGNPFESWDAPSYEESVIGAIEHAVETILKLPQGCDIVIGGYSQGAHVVELLKSEFQASGRLKFYSLLGIYTFGNPGRLKGVTFPNGNVLPWSGITKLDIATPAGSIYRSYAFYDDMYANANPNSYLYDFYVALTDIQFHDPWKAVQEGILNLSKTDIMILMGAKPTDIKWIISNFGKFISMGTKAVNSIDAAARFVRSGAHGHYHDWQIIPGYTPVFHAIRSMKYLAKGNDYAVPGI